MRFSTALAYTLLFVDVASSDDSSYTYLFQMDLSTPLSGSLDDCIGWQPGDSSTNFTWYGISFQLPEDTQSISGGWNTAPAQPLKKDGYVQMFNVTALGVADFNFTTSADRPVIRTRINNGMLWESFTFDFADGSNYVEQKSYQSVSCKISESGEGLNKTTTFRSVVRPTMAVSLERLSGPAPTPAPKPEPSSSFMTGSFFAMTALALASSAFLLL
mmetsp:Transcript_8663/g.12424  ORF Transcript_8663/g.12424 Transcript_8663/m.12424 type:complete len:216 (-) Transcript_8663:44-691(-)|eukprot:CAMPEP_0201694454 /NCGR_PEP_ID=MMETSP0578-20130828/6723_1 /ASSEMBLY_ACC=CAM_ASM_000663 /TAXON_ID=267565 /ORGANISM="Skeletonema grethea, Strain CCMP 1804" /LENGTH=215 /DNA_ID=CAMNT_0048180141 /DNA_START=86 /DNA_END=733 /DNA_ORIENTATION=-